MLLNIQLHQLGIIFFELVNKRLQRFRVVCGKRQFPQGI